MKEDDFAAALRQDGFTEFVTVERPAGEALGEHTHPFEARALILAGDITVVAADGARRYGVGEVFHLRAGQPHSESYGPAGVKYLVGRK